MEHAIDIHTDQIQQSVNAMIKAACERESWRLHQQIAERIIEREIGNEWDYICVSRFGGFPEIVLTHYKGDSPFLTPSSA